ncbi:hypothetical protein Tsubulata_029215, partial [Turnera subulata]
MLKSAPPFLHNLLMDETSNAQKQFQERIRMYNASFAMTSLGDDIDVNTNKSYGPFVICLNGQNHHRIGSLLPVEGTKPKYAQLYIFDTGNEITNRMTAFLPNTDTNILDLVIIQNLIIMFDQHNELIKSFRIARDRLKHDEWMPVKLRMVASRNTNMSPYNMPTCEEIDGLIVGDFHNLENGRDIIIEHRTDKLQRINILHPSFMSMRYPILFPYGEDGFHLEIPYNNTNQTAKRKYVTMREFYNYTQAFEMLLTKEISFIGHSITTITGWQNYTFKIQNTDRYQQNIDLRD